MKVTFLIFLMHQDVLIEIQDVVTICDLFCLIPKQKRYLPFLFLNPGIVFSLKSELWQGFLYSE